MCVNNGVQYTWCVCVNNGVKYTWCVCVNNGVKYTWCVCVNNGVNDANYFARSGCDRDWYRKLTSKVEESLSILLFVLSFLMCVEI